MKILCIALLTIFATELARGQVQIAFMPTQAVIGSNATQTIRCTGDGIDDLYAITFSKGTTQYLSGSPSAIPEIDWVLGVNQDIKSRANFNYELKSSPPYLEMIFSSIVCPTDSGEYICGFYGTLAPGGGAAEHTASRNLTIQSIPDNVRVDASYDVSMDFTQPPNTAAVGQRVILTCNANVGAPALRTRWLRYRYSATSASGARDFQELQFPDANNITDDSVVSVPNQCTNSRKSTLTYYVQAEDLELEFRCAISSSFDVFLSDPYADVKIELYGFQSVATTQKPSTGGSGKTQTGNPKPTDPCHISTGNHEPPLAICISSPVDAGIIAGAVVGAVAFILIIVVLVYFCWWRRRDGGGESYKTDEGSRPAPPEKPEVYENEVYDKDSNQNRANGGDRGGGGDHYAELDHSKPSKKGLIIHSSDPPTQYAEIRI